MIAPKLAKPTPREEREAYDTATDRDSIDGQPVCQRCRRDCGGTQRDHRQNRQSGNTVASNLQILGAGCHSWKSTHPDEAIDQGWSVPRNIGGLLPSDIPAKRWVTNLYGVSRLVWVLLDDLGGVLEISDTEAAYRRRKAGIIS